MSATQTKAPPTPTTDRDLIGRFWDALVAPGDVHEVRMPDTHLDGPRRLYGVSGGYFDDRDAFVADVARIGGRDADAVFLTLNPTVPRLLARAANRIKSKVKVTTADADILRRRHLLIDVDPLRPAGLSSTDAERDEAVRGRDRLRRYLYDELGWPDPVMATMSGNGGGLIYRIDLPNDADSTTLVEGALKGAQALFGTDRIAIDTTTSNAARITKIAGTVSAKGDNVPDQPWRTATAKFAPEPESVSRERLLALAAFAPKPEPRKTAPAPNGAAHERTWDIREVLRNNAVGFTEKKLSYATRFELDRCLTSADHTAGAVVLEFPSGALAYSCRHNRCQGKAWADVRPLLKIPRSEGTGSTSTGGSNTKHQNGHGAAEEAQQATTEVKANLLLTDFASYLPERKYLYMPTGKVWDPAGIDRYFPPIGSGDEAVKQSTIIDGRCPVHDLTWAPGKPQIIEDAFLDQGGWIAKAGARVYNGYRPPRAMEGNPAKAERWLDHVGFVYPDDAEHLIDWFAHRVQRPGEKVNHALVLGGAQGIGKDTILEPVRHAVGPWNFGDVSPVVLQERFNAFLKSVVLRVSELRDLGDRDRFGFYEHTKTLIAVPPDTVRIDEKHIRAYLVPNVVGVVFTTNHRTDGLYLPAEDRRHYVAWSDLTPGDFADGYWSDLYRWFTDGGGGGGGVAHVAAFLAGRDLSGFDPKAPPPKTAAFWDIVAAGKAPEDADVTDAIETITARKGLADAPDALTIEDIAEASDDLDFKSWLRDRKNARQIPHRLEAVGYVVTRNPENKSGLWMVGGRRQTVYARRDLTIRQRIEAAQKRAGR